MGIRRSSGVLTWKVMKSYSPALAMILLACLWWPATGGAAQPPSRDEPAEVAPPQEPAEPVAPQPESPPSQPKTPAETPEDQPVVLAQRFVDWLRDIDPIILQREKLAFLGLRTDYQRDAFIQRFWQARDPFPETSRNELKDRWERYSQLARSLYGSLNDDRARILLVHGKPATAFEVRCTTTRSPVEIWVYRGTEQVDADIILVFFRAQGTGPGRLWVPTGFSGEETFKTARECLNGEQMAQAVALIRRSPAEYDLQLQRILAKPAPRSEEWLSTFASFSTDLPAGAELFDASVEVRFLGRYQSRTVTQGLLRVPVSEVAPGELAGYRSYEFVLTGEVVVDDHLFESFRYKFGLPTDAFGEKEIPLAFQRYLRPGDYQLLLKLEDLHGERFFRWQQELSVPQIENLYDAPVRIDPESAELFAEATAAVADGETSIKIIPPRLDLLTGFNRFDTLALGGDIQRVAFSLDGRHLLTKNRPPFNVEIDLGPFPRLHELRVEALDAEERLVASDELLINSGGNRFQVKLVEPRRGQTYRQSLLVRAEVEVPEERSLERLEIFLDETLVATLYQPPFTQPVRLPSSNAISYVRAVAYLPDGNSTEDLVFVNAPDYLEEVDVQFVELYATVLDRDGRPVAGLQRGDFQVTEDGVPQKLARFEPVADLPIHVGIVLDNSGSMRESLQQSKFAALRFFQQVVGPKDRAAVITFNRLPVLAVKLTNDLRVLGGGLAGLTAEGETALYDSLMFSLYYFTGIKGQRALLLLSDGKDEVSRFSFEETLEYARRAGITIYTVGLRLRDFEARTKLEKLSSETGGRSFFVGDVDQLEQIYDLIQQDLRSQYLLAYQSSNTANDEGFRSVDVEVKPEGLAAKTISGYYP